MNLDGWVIYMWLDGCLCGYAGLMGFFVVDVRWLELDVAGSC
jgi:hypothetical protein